MTSGLITPSVQIHIYIIDWFFDCITKKSAFESHQTAFHFPAGHCLFPLCLTSASSYTFSSHWGCSIYIQAPNLYSFKLPLIAWFKQEVPSSDCTILLPSESYGVRKWNFFTLLTYPQVNLVFHKNLLLDLRLVRARGFSWE